MLGTCATHSITVAGGDGGGAAAVGKELREQPGFQADLAHYLSGMRFVGRPKQRCTSGYTFIRYVYPIQLLFRILSSIVSDAQSVALDDW